MIILAIEVLCVIILGIILMTVIIDEKKNHTRKMRMVKLEGYWSGTERRSTARLNVSLEVKYSINGKISDTRSINISARGVGLLLDEKIKEGTILGLEIKIPREERIVKVTSKVVWSRESPEDEKNSTKRFFNTGLRFFKFQKNDAKRLFDFIHGLES